MEARQGSFECSDINGLHTCLNTGLVDSNSGLDLESLDGLKHLCLDDELTKVVAERLGARPKKVLSPEQKRENSNPTEPPAAPVSIADRGSIPSTPAFLRKQQKKKNRKDRRRNDEDLGGARLGVERSNSARCIPSTSRLPSATSIEVVSSLIFKSQSSVNISTGIRNLPDSFFNDDLPEDLQKAEGQGKKQNKKKKKGKKKEEERKVESEEVREGSDKENEHTKEVREGSDKENEDSKEVRENQEGEAEEEETVYNWRNVTKNGDVKKCILVEGNREEGRPMHGDVVLVKSQGKLKDGTMIDDYPTLVFRVGEYEVVEGLDLVVQSMHKNELAIVSIKPNLAYGELGRKPDIPTNSRITYLFGLLHFEKQKDVSEMTWAQRRKMGQSRMRIASWWYSRKEYPIAVKCYKKALQFYNNIPTNQQCSTPEEYRELLTLMEERLRVMRQVANIFKRIANLIQSGHIET